MRPFWLGMVGLGAVFLGVGVSASAQMRSAQIPPTPAPSFQTTPLPPLQEQQSRTPSVPPKPNTPPATVERTSIWVPAGAAKLQALDKVSAQATALTIKVGQAAAFGSLTIMVKACATRPPDQPADAAAYLEVTDSHPDSPGFAGWMLENEPSASMLQHPVYDLRVAGCA